MPAFKVWYAPLHSRCRELRINAVSPPWVKETMVKLGMDPTSGLASADVAKAYVAAVEGSHQGVILDPRQLGK